MMQQEGKLGKIIFNNPENGYTVAIFDTEDGSFRIAGSFAEPKTGANYRLEGRFTVHPKYGEQFSVSGYEEIMPEGADAILDFLSAGNIRGIGPVTAKAIVEVFGDETLTVIEETPEKLLMISGIGARTLAKITESFGESREFANTAIELREIGIELSEAVRVYKMYGKDSVRIIKENPYVLAEDIRGINFSKADSIAARLGVEPDSSVRIESGIRYMLKAWAASGSTLVPESLLVEKTAAFLDVMMDNVRDSLKDMVFAGELEEDTVGDITVIYLYGYYHAEQRVAHALTRIRDAAPKQLPMLTVNAINAARENAFSMSGGDIELSDEQQAAIEACLTNNITIITGGPGTGKTTIINTLVKIFDFAGLETALAAPTGRAAKRMEEASGKPAMTIHRLLEFVWSDEEDTLNFGRNEENPLEQDVIIIDEASMIDLMLMDGLLDAIKEGTRLIFTGDADQLPSVGAGNVLRDMIASECIPTIRLREIFRQAEGSGIVSNSHLINNGEYPAGQGGDDFFIISKTHETAVSDTIRELIGGRIEAGFGFVRSADDIQVLTPTKRGMLGAPSLNAVLQEVINPADGSKAELKLGNVVFREGDKVMQLRNNYGAEWRSDDYSLSGEGVFNGDMGTIESIDTADKTMTVRMDDRLIVYAGDMLEEIDLAYAITVHKSQGSEFPAVIIPVLNFPPMLMTRNLLYTAVTRGKKLVVIVGDPNRVRAMIDNNRADGRYTGLKERLVSLDADPFGRGLY
ncbi:MAG: ATP-dependent RecD-like DNA helicase [Mogibacterium sp.]|nr:ATP-dependent RecD-like DNA helicase [Mogibacterium sp.]